MKHLKQLLLVLLVLVCVCGIAGCDSKSEKTKIGILQYATHDALDNARIGFVQALKDAGFEDSKNIEIVVKNPEGDNQTIVTYATELVRECDIVLGIATPAAIQLQSARNTEQSDCKILFTAVTDAVSAGLVEANDKTTDNITGTHDMNPVKDQIDLIVEVLPNVKKIGVIYNINEVNSKVQCDLAKASAEELNIEVIVKTVSETSEIAAVTSAIISEGAEVLYLPTDNLIASNMPAIVASCEEKNIMTVCGESGMVTKGGSITYSINYTALGVLTGEMAVNILNGTAVADIPVTTVDINGIELVINEDSFTNIGITIPESIKERLSK